MESKEFSLEGFEFLKFLKGNRKVIIAGAAYLLALVLTDTQLIGFLSAGFFSAAYSVIEFYLKKVELE
jgi:hypothetical protein